MLKKRVIPTLLWKDVGLVKGVGFSSWRRIGAVLPAVKVYNAREVDELILLDISATCSEREPNFSAVSEIAGFCFVPLTVGGGIRALDHIKQLLRSGADKVSINSYAYENPEFIKAASIRFGSQCIVVSIDVKRNDEGEYMCYAHAGNKETGIPVLTWAKKMETMGAGELLLTSIERDGTMKGYDIELVASIAREVGIPVIASGGAGAEENFYHVLEEAGASAVAAASVFHFTEQTPKLVKKYLHEAGVPVRGFRAPTPG